MARRSPRTRDAKSARRANDGAHLPLVDPRLFGQVGVGADDRRARLLDGEAIILSEDDLSQYDPQRVQELRAALARNAAAPVRGARARRRPVHPEQERRTRRGVIVSGVFLLIALAVGMAIGVVA